MPTLFSAKRNKSTLEPKQRQKPGIIVGIFKAAVTGHASVIQRREIMTVDIVARGNLTNGAVFLLQENTPKAYTYSVKKGAR